MTKGVSTIIATILMLMITIALAGTAYLYISGAFTQQTQGIELLDSYCTPAASDTTTTPATPRSTVTITVRNVGTSDLPTSSVACTQTAPSSTVDTTGCVVTWSGTPAITSIGPGVTASFTEFCTGSGARTCVYRLSPASGRSAVATAACS